MNLLRSTLDIVAKTWTKIDFSSVPNYNIWDKKNEFSDTKINIYAYVGPMYMYVHISSFNDIMVTNRNMVSVQHNL